MFVAVVVVCFWRSSWLAFLILTYYIKLMHQFLTPLSYLLWRLSYRSYRIFWKRLFAKNNFWVFLSVPHLLDNYAKIVDGRGRNFMCHRTLPSRLVAFSLKLKQKKTARKKRIQMPQIDFEKDYSIITKGSSFLIKSNKKIFCS